MDLHPITVHFPIALLTIYALMEIVRLPIFTRQLFWFPMKAVLLLLGTAGSIVSLQTGEIAEHLAGGGNALIEKHAQFANITTYFFVILTVCYVLTWCAKLGQQWCQKPVLRPAVKVAYVVAETPLAIILAIVGMVLITIVGALGGAIVYGPHASDPIIGLVYYFFFPK